MSDTLNLLVELSVTDSSSSCCTGCDPLVQRTLEETVGLDGAPQTGRVDLATDGVESIAFGDLTNAHVVLLAVTGGKVRARLTSADGSQQSVPVDDLFVLVSRTVPITAIDLMRVAASGQTPRVNFVLAQKV